MKPGRELDALVAEKVMGWRLPTYEGLRKGDPHNTLGINYTAIMDRESTPKPYSTDISAAWEVVEKFKKENVCCAK